MLEVAAEVVTPQVRPAAPLKRGASCSSSSFESVTPQVRPAAPLKRFVGGKDSSVFDGVTPQVRPAAPLKP